MDLPGRDDGPQPLAERPLSVSAAFEGSEEIAEARDLTRSFLADVQAVHGMAVSRPAVGMKARRTVRDYERLPQHSEAHLTCALITLMTRKGTRTTWSKKS
ncbi:hypothetical protein GCM10010377_73000 [Streptomyces viridiviolaceus]|uniref:Uncharacterized protein n=1 Tax=Streptomyces viridiviolaceus TaxID=68282 RepID=A0ABW2DUR9_9ACTN|nr:hypothetical protein GCM10010377_73000 [Streptomyces viridiviolaceus]